jgi:predicted Zn-dependent protease
MTIRLSEFPEYLAAIPAAADGEFASARSNLGILLTKVESKCEPEELAYLLQLLGDVEARAGNLEAAFSLQERALAADSSSPLTLLLCAKSLLGSFQRPDLALAKLHQAELLLASDKWSPTENDMSRQWYEQEIRAVRQTALQHEP